LVVAALIERANNILLTQRRADQMLPFYWEFPGGKVEANESPAQALRREIREEIGCRIKVEDLAEVVYHPYPQFDLVMPVYWAKIISGEPHPIEVAKVAWVRKIHLLRRKLPPADLPLARALSRPTR
jgi:8-oxo-dGTP diphosphatase